jgi:hypothetical protein
MGVSVGEKQLLTIARGGDTVVTPGSRPAIDVVG